MAGDFNQKDIELLFIREILDQHGEYLCDILAENIEQKDLIKEGNLLDSLNYKVSMTGGFPSLELSFYSYGRAIEISYYKRSSNTKKWAQVNTNRLLWNIKSREDKKPKNRNLRWYSKAVYGSQNRLISMLANEFTEQEVHRLKGILEAQQLRNYISK